MGESLESLANKVLISTDILRQIDEVHTEVSKHAQYREQLMKQETKALYEESTVNSGRLEYELMRIHGEKKYGHSLSRKDAKKEAKRIGKQVATAWKHLAENFKGDITEDLILDAGFFIDRKANNKKEIRITSARLGEISGIDPTKLKVLLPKFLEEFNGNFIYAGNKLDENPEKVKITPVEKAAYAHFITFIAQPLYDGNKRTGRLLQNLILQKAHLPPAVIYGPEGEDYMEKLVAAQKGYQNRGAGDYPGQLISPEESKFFDYIGNKVLISLQHIDDLLTGAVSHSDKESKE